MMKKDSQKIQGVKILNDEGEEIAEGSVLKKEKGVTTVVTKESIFCGPFPSPDQLEKYKEIYSDAPKIIFEDFERISKKEIEWNDKIIHSNISEGRRGQIMGYIITVFALFVALICAYLNQPAIGCAVVGPQLFYAISKMIKK